MLETLETFRRVQLSITVNIRHCIRMNNFLSEADLVSFNICFNQKYKKNMKIIWALSRENLSLGFPIKQYSNQPAQLQRLARNLKFRLYQK